ncbi:Pre-mRNA-splicing factor [Sorochytrium milnesiophthora]
MADDIRLKRPARRQLDPAKQEQTQKVYEGTYNIWYNKWTGQKNQGRFERGERATARVNVDKDTGYTAADKRAKANPNTKTYFCLQFARGQCYQGHKCDFYHRIPRTDDAEETIKDCFGRERHRDERDDMGGVGSFNREGRTLYIGNLHPYGSTAEKVVAKHFGEFGEIAKLRVIHPKSIAFVQYKKRACAEFAREAMDHQTLDAGEILNVRWANDDPNPTVKAEIKRKQEEDFVESWVTKKARTGELAYVDEETKQLLAANPTYQQYYQYYQDGDGTATATTTTSTTENGEPKADAGAPTATVNYTPQELEAYYQYYYHQQQQQQQQQHTTTATDIEQILAAGGEKSTETAKEEDKKEQQPKNALGLAAYQSSSEDEGGDDDE